MDVKTLLIDTLQTFKYPIYLQGSMAKDEQYPDSFFTFWNNDTTSSSFYDNQEHDIVWDFDLNFYSNDPSSVNNVLLQVKTELKSKGFIIDGLGYDVLSDEPTHTGRGMNLIFIDKVRT